VPLMRTLNIRPLFWTLFLALATAGVAILIWFLIAGY
jgi:hypothetical protein